ncbi:MAG: glycosyltransferase family 2 protein [Phycisphaerales bacterium]
MPVLFVVIPFFNEAGTLEPCVTRVLAAELPRSWSLSVVLVDDASDAESRAAAGRLATLHGGHPGRLELLSHLVNRGKGAALRTGFRRVLERCADEDDAVLIQDADLEYDPADYAALLAALPSPRTPAAAARCAVYGNRWGGAAAPGAVRTLHRAGNRLLTGMSNLLTGYTLGDMECCYKLLPVPLLRQLVPLLTEDRFGVEPQVTALLARLGVTVTEVPVRYAPRGFSAGKKIGMRDALRAVWVIVRERLRRLPAPGAAR